MSKDTDKTTRPTSDDGKAFTTKQKSVTKEKSQQELNKKLQHETELQTEQHKKRQPQQDKKEHRDKRDLMLSREDARGGSPADVSVAGEEDAGVGLEFLVNRREDRSPDSSR